MPSQCLDGPGSPRGYTFTLTKLGEQIPLPKHSSRVCRIQPQTAGSLGTAGAGVHAADCQHFDKSFTSRGDHTSNYDGSRSRQKKLHGTTPRETKLERRVEGWDECKMGAEDQVRQIYLCFEKSRVVGVPAMARCVKNLTAEVRFDLRPGNFHMPWVCPLEKKSSIPTVAQQIKNLTQCP